MPQLEFNFQSPYGLGGMFYGEHPEIDCKPGQGGGHGNGHCNGQNHGNGNGHECGNGHGNNTSNGNNGNHNGTNKPDKKSLDYESVALTSVGKEGIVKGVMVENTSVSSGSALILVSATIVSFVIMKFIR